MFPDYHDLSPLPLSKEEIMQSLVSSVSLLLVPWFGSLFTKLRTDYDENLRVLHDPGASLIHSGWAGINGSPKNYVILSVDKYLRSLNALWLLILVLFFIVISGVIVGVHSIFVIAVIIITNGNSCK